MYIRASPLTVVRVSRKCSKTATFIFIILALITFFLLGNITENRIGSNYYTRQAKFDAPNLSQNISKESDNEDSNETNFDIRRPQSSAYNREIELKTWTQNQSVSLEEYLEPWNINSFLLQPYQTTDHNDLTSNLSTYCGSLVKILILISSAPANIDARNAIRNTWGSNENLAHRGIKKAFVIGISNNDTIEELVNNESKKFGDILEEDFIDSYHNLTLKSITMLKWVNLTCFNHAKNTPDFPQYFLKTDDDIFFNIDVLLAVIKSLPKAKMIGRLICGATPITDISSKFYMPRYLFSESAYPGYLSGTAYILKGDIIPSLFNKALTTPLIHLEDIYVTGLLARQNNIYPDDSGYFTYLHIDPKDKCAFRYMVNSHQVSPKEMYQIWTSVRKPLKCSKNKKYYRRVPRLTKRIKKICHFN